MVAIICLLLSASGDIIVRAMKGDTVFRGVYCSVIVATCIVCNGGG